MIENWAHCDKAPNYEVSNLGRVRRRGIILNPWTNDRGYSLLDVGGGKKLRVHRMVYESFVGPLEAGQVIDHVNCIKTDNRLSNLEAVTHAENMRRAAANGRCGNQPPARKPYKRMTSDEKERIFQMRLSGMTNAQVMLETGRCRSAIQKIFSGSVATKRVSP